MTDYFNIKLPKGDIQAISSLGLAHLGDAVYELMVRAWLCKNGRAALKGLHRAAVSYVNATAQASAVKKIMDVLTEEELSVYKRGRNAKVNSIPQNASLEEYHAATGLEALFGHLYLDGKTERINELFEMIMEGHIE